MKYYMAPMEGVTTYIFRQAYHKYYSPMDKYFIPFFVPHKQKRFTSREKNELDQNHNKGMHVIPQILTSNAEDFIRLARNIQEVGYEEINWNVGCPSKTVAAKGRGAAFLGEPDKLDRFLDTIYTELTDMRISVKTRIGKDDADEWEDLVAIYNQYPLLELIVHPRVQVDYYKNTPQWDKMVYAVQQSKQPLCYNGDLFSLEHYEKWREQFPSIDCIMLGRGLVGNPLLKEEIQQKKRLTDRERFKKFHDEVYEGYKEIMSGDRNVLFKMKELWSYFQTQYPDARKTLKKIQKCEKCVIYESIMREILQ